MLTSSCVTVGRNLFTDGGLPRCWLCLLTGKRQAGAAMWVSHSATHTVTSASVSVACNAQCCLTVFGPQMSLSTPELSSCSWRCSARGCCWSSAGLDPAASVGNKQLLRVSFSRNRSSSATSAARPFGVLFISVLSLLHRGPAVPGVLCTDRR